MDDLTLITCSYNTPYVTLTMLKSFAQQHEGKHKLILVENSTNRETQNLLDKNNVPYYVTDTCTHSKSVQWALEHCQTSHALLVDTDIIFKKNIFGFIQQFKDNNLAIAGCVCGNRGMKILKNRVHPWFCYINVDIIKEHHIDFFDPKRIGGQYDVGCSFFEDINKHQLKIGDINLQDNYFIHYEGMSWRVQKYDPTKPDTHSIDTDPNGTHNIAKYWEYGQYIMNDYQKEIAQFSNVCIKQTYRR